VSSRSADDGAAARRPTVSALPGCLPCPRTIQTSYSGHPTLMFARDC
jgi:hypothetical protein